MPIPSPFHFRTNPLNQLQEGSDWAGYIFAVRPATPTTVVVECRAGIPPSK